LCNKLFTREEANLFKKAFLIITAFVFLILLSLAGCSRESAQNQMKGGLGVYSWSSGLGSVNNIDLDKTKFSYSVDLTNENNKSIFIKSIQPVVSDTIKDKMLNNELMVTVNKHVASNETIQVNGEIIIDTKGLNKSDIQKLDPFITDIKVISEEIIDLRK
jgi:hypothetical protein